MPNEFIMTFEWIMLHKKKCQTSSQDKVSDKEKKLLQMILLISKMEFYLDKQLVGKYFVIVFFQSAEPDPLK